MKGLSLNCLGKKEEAYENVKRGLKNDLSSFICWHAYGLLQRSDYKYDEAIKCYRNALKWNQNNIQIWRDLSALQIQMRDLEGYSESRFQLFKLRPTQRASWIGFALSLHLLKEYESATNILEEFRKSENHNRSGGKVPVVDYENSEILLYQITLYIEGGHFERALEYLNRYQDEICDKVALNEYQAEVLIKMNRTTEAVQIIKDKLINRNPDNRAYYKLIERALGIENDEKKRHKLYLDYQKKCPSAQLPFRTPLDFLSDLNDFRSHLNAYLRKSLRKGQPALFKDVKQLYRKSEEKMQIVEQLMQEYRENLIKHLSFDSDPSTSGSEDVTTIVWVTYYLAQHYNYLKQNDRAMELIDESIQHTPTLIELYMFKAKIYKAKGELDEAVECIVEAQSLDTADRYLNAKCVKYMLRANKIKEAEEMSSRFTRDGLPANDDLNEMQCMWYQSEVAHAYYRLKNYGEALKKCHEIDRHFTEMNEDQFDFHSYCIRKVTLRAYVDLLRLVDVLKEHPFYFNIAKLAIEIYLHLLDNPLKAEENMLDSNTDQQKNESNKPMVNGKRSKKDKKNKQESINENSNKENDQKNTTKGKDKMSNSNVYSSLHSEPLIAKDLERPKDALKEAERFLKPLQMFASNRIETHLLAFEIYYRKNKLLLMLQSLKRAVRLDCKNNKLDEQLKLFSSLVNDKRDELNQYVAQVIDIELTKIYNGSLNSGDQLSSVSNDLIALKI